MFSDRAFYEGKAMRCAGIHGKQNNRRFPVIYWSFEEICDEI